MHKVRTKFLSSNLRAFRGQNWPHLASSVLETPKYFTWKPLETVLLNKTTDVQVKLMINKRCNDLINAWHELTRVFDLFCKRRRKAARNEEKNN